MPKRRFNQSLSRYRKNSEVVALGLFILVVTVFVRVDVVVFVRAFLLLFHKSFTVLLPNTLFIVYLLGQTAMRLSQIV